MTSGPLLLLLALQQPPQLMGSVRDSTLATPIAGAVVQLLDSTGRSYDRTVTDVAGRYRLTPTAAVTRVQFLKLGYRPRTYPLATLRDSTLDVTMARLPTLLARVTASTNRQCPRRRDSDAALALWQQARAGLLQSVVASTASRARLNAAVFERFTYDDEADNFRPQAVRLDSGNAGFAASLGARDFLRLGFIQPDARGGRTIFGIDADVLLHEDFSAGYCFSIADPQRNRPTQMGLRFQPASRAEDRVDIDGTLWVDTLARTIRDIQFLYLGFDRIARGVRPGGSTYFVTMPNGQTLISEWVLRVISVVPDTLRYSRDVRRFAPRPTYRVYETGGELTHARWPAPDTASYHATLATLRLRLANARGHPLRNYAVRLDSTDYRAVTDSAGNAVLHDLIPGTYRLGITDTSLAKLGGPDSDTLTFAAIRGGTIVRTLAVHTAADYVAEYCGNTLDEPTGRVIVARVFTPEGQPADGVEWEANLRRGKTDKSGIIVVCLRGVSGPDGQLFAPASLDVLLWPPKGKKEPQTAQLQLANRVTVVRIDILDPP